MYTSDVTSTFTSWTSYTNNLSKFSSTMKQLASGLKELKEDPAGVSIGQRMEYHLGSAQAAVQNIDNSISMNQTADGWLDKVGGMLSRMKSISVQANSGMLSSEDEVNLKVEFKAMQREIDRISSKYNAAAQFNDLYLLRGGNGVSDDDGKTVEEGELEVQTGPEIDQTTEVQMPDLDENNEEVIGEVVTYDEDDNAVTTDVTWSEIIDSSETGIQPGDELSIGKIDAAIDFVADARAENAAKQSVMEKQREGLVSYSDNLNSSAAKLTNIDMAYESTQFTASLILSQVSQAIMGQGMQLSGASMLSLIRG